MSGWNKLYNTCYFKWLQTYEEKNSNLQFKQTRKNNSKNILELAVLLIALSESMENRIN